MAEARLKGGGVARSRSINTTQALVLGFFAAAWVSLVVMLAVSADMRQVLTQRLPSAGAPAVIGLAVAVLSFLTVLAAGVVAQWHWLFWLILVAFAAGLIRIPVAVLQLSGRMTPDGPDWYVVVQAAVGAIQFAIAAAMYRGYRRSGPWGSF